MTAYPDLTVPPEAGDFVDVEDVFNNGYCHALAVAIWRITDWRIRGLFVRLTNGRPDLSDHYVAERPDGYLADVEGIRPPQVLLGMGYELTEPLTSPEGLWYARDMENAEVVRELAETVAARIVNGG